MEQSLTLYFLSFLQSLIKFTVVCYALTCLYWRLCVTVCLQNYHMLQGMHLLLYSVQRVQEVIYLLCHACVNVFNLKFHLDICTTNLDFNEFQWWIRLKSLMLSLIRISDTKVYLKLLIFYLHKPWTQSSVRIIFS